jgi:hypothetical protein
MEVDKLIQYLGIDNKFGYKNKESIFKKNLPDEYLKIVEYNKYHFNNNTFIWRQNLYNYIHNIQELPKCKNENCNNKTNFSNQYNKYFDYCSNKCIQTSKFIIEKKKRTTLKNNGVEFPMQSNIVRKKSKETLKINYGVDNPSKSKEILERKVVTNIKKYGVKNFSNTDEFKSIMHNYHNDNTINTFIEKLNLRKDDIEIIDNNLVKIKNYCPIHNEFIISKDNIYNRTRLKLENICTECFPINDNSSIKEIEIRDFINNELNIKTEKIKIENKEIDIYIPTHKLGIEHDGIYYHSTSIKKNYSNKHLEKTELCEKNDIQLLHIFEDEWILKKEMVKSIIKSKLEIFDNKILASECILKEIDNIIINNFLSNNHIQGVIESKIGLGLFYNNDLVSVMTFGKKRIAIENKTNIDNEYEILRFCNKLNTQVISSASKLLNYFIEIYKPKSILIFVDRRYSQGNLYKQLGFKILYNTQPNYWYFEKHSYKKYHRYDFRKDALISEGFDKNKTEFEIMDDREYLRVYDCGSMKFEMIL